ncbi:ComF family protein [Nannocystis punicea]|uniref:Phosphoribosyltransferase family protein n=1 Tax=Nannocystis punicea TaxID=2995304 RepID=A0ABY7HG19_9BACT|nr:phosphoribosyltransferase family protein [Nannocystis poenicansa]WAS98249.1 phosphoribosyltransferase family protein [Nannocystis poenicansa]
MLLDFLSPPVCLACRHLLRAPARGGLPPLCSRCAPELAPLDPAARRLGDVEACFLYEGPLASAVRRLKYDGQLELAGPLGRLLAHAPAWREGWDLVAPVPLHWRRALARGYNQAALLARWAAREAPLGARLRPRLLQRVRATPPQTELDGAARRDNLAGAIVVRSGRSLAGLRVLVVDDVTTTGATLDACLRAVRSAGAARAAGLALLRSAL